jgi:hypothetical protein
MYPQLGAQVEPIVAPTGRGIAWEGSTIWAYRDRPGTIAEVFARNVARDPDREAYVFHPGGERMTWRDTGEQVDRVAARLRRDYGVRKGDRLYGRGSADDMGGWLSHFVAMEAWFTETGKLPCNVKILLEGEEEIGSPNLEKFMDAFPDAFESDAMVLTDCENPSVDIPGLTVSLRGLLEIEVSVTSAKSDVHSGLWGNIVPDPAMTLVALLARDDRPQLQRDAARALATVTAGAAEHVEAVVVAGAVPPLVRLLAADDDAAAAQAARVLGNVAGDSTRARDLAAFAEALEAEGLVAAAVGDVPL